MSFLFSNTNGIGMSLAQPESDSRNAIARALAGIQVVVDEPANV
jgi:hypothetical protein